MRRSKSESLLILTPGVLEKNNKKKKKKNSPERLETISSWEPCLGTNSHLSPSLHYWQWKRGLLKCCCCLVCSGTVLFSNDQCSVPQLLFFSPVVITLGKTFLILHCLGWIVQQSRVKPMKLLNNSHMNFAQWPLLFQGLTLHYLKQNHGDEHCSAFILS